MPIELKLRLQAYAATAEAHPSADPSLYADALSSSSAASAAGSAVIICSHTRILRGDSPPAHLLPGQHELDLLVAEPASADPAPKSHLPLPAGSNTLEKLALGAAGIPAIKVHE